VGSRYLRYVLLFSMVRWGRGAEAVEAAEAAEAVGIEAIEAIEAGAVGAVGAVEAAVPSCCKPTWSYFSTAIRIILPIQIDIRILIDSSQ
jgi:hypothetical protein